MVLSRATCVMAIAYALIPGRSGNLSPSSWLIVPAILGVWLFVLAGPAEVPSP